MGIYVYMRWEGQTEKEKNAQFTGFDVTAGNVGYLREAYHGEPYATKLFVGEAFESETEIPSIALFSRLPKVMELVEVRYKDEEKLLEKVKISFFQFAELARRKEKETGKPVSIYVSW